MYFSILFFFSFCGEKPPRRRSLMLIHASILLSTHVSFPTPLLCKIRICKYISHSFYIHTSIIITVATPLDPKAIRPIYMLPASSPCLTFPLVRDIPNYQHPRHALRLVCRLSPTRFHHDSLILGMALSPITLMPSSRLFISLPVLSHIPISSRKDISLASRARSTAVLYIYTPALVG
jgi:hypothetical protein